MNRHIITVPPHAEPWLVNLIELKNRTDVTIEEIAEREDLCKKSVGRVFSGEAKNPGVDLVRRIIHALGGSFADIFTESGAVIGGKDLDAAHDEIAVLNEKIGNLTAELKLTELDLKVARDRVTDLEAENKVLLVKLECAEKIAAMHDYYSKLLSR